MIVVTRLNTSRFAINPDLIERIQENPDTVVVMVNGATYVVTESMEEVIGLVMRYRASVVSTARLQGAESPSSGLPSHRPRTP
ncbi:flagellar FlbD family protein [Paeniglutamicibacter sp. NPDC091659]|uniref:flagellar FlbD family protein n=1 Tax=Paeniglutamicibacter sp. NPDC091659 TaxID=3364389 RepID=UPI0037F4A409